MVGHRPPVRLITPPDRGQLIAPHRIGPIVTPGNESTPATLTLEPEHAEAARNLALLIGHHRSLVAQLEAQLVGMAREAYHADITPGGDWMLNVAEGRLERSKPATPPDAAPERPASPEIPESEDGEGAMG